LLFLYYLQGYLLFCFEAILDIRFNNRDAILKWQRCTL